MKIIFSSILLFYTPIAVFGQQDSLDLHFFYEQLNQNYPMAQKQDIQEKITELNLKLSHSGYFPDIIFNASTSYQSDVTEVPFAPAGMAPEFSKDHYNVSAEINQTLFDGGRIRTSKKMESSYGAAEMASARAEMWGIRRQLEQVYFRILLLQKRKTSIELHAKTVQEQLNSVKAKVSNGILLPANELVLKAELIKLKQELLQVDEEVKTAFEMLSILTDTEIDTTIQLAIPEIELTDQHIKHSLERKELQVFEERRNSFQSQIDLTNANALPIVSAFARAGYGRPGLNAFDDDLQTFWVLGVRAQWNFKNWSNSNRKKEVIQLQQRKLDVERESLTRQINTQLATTQNRIVLLQKQIKLDEDLLQLRREIVNEKQNLMDQGVITSTEFLTELNAESQARLNLQTRQLQLVQTVIEFYNTKGIEWEN